ncbi:MAG: TonB-dependent receptor [Verrucomicrobiota bacterium]|nr:TonB-dependent receptor [Verrucomicrobiota bacterium]
MKKFVTFAFALLSSASLAPAQIAVASPSPVPSVTQTNRIIVTGGEIERSSTDSAQAVTVLNDAELKQRAAATLGDTLASQAGVAASGFAPGASRPIIRGLSDNRVRVLNDGTEVFDVSNLSPDHAASVSPLISQSIEIVRGPATILYGSGAIGGVVNVVDNRIPVELPPNPFNGEFDARFASGSLERSVAGQLDVALTSHFVLHLDGSFLRTDSRRIPGFALSERVRRGLTPEQSARGDDFGGDPDGEVPNTYVETKDWAIGGSYVWDKGYIGASFNQFLSVYGIPDNPEVDDPTVVPSRVRLDVTKRQGNVRSSIADPFPGFGTLNLKFVYTDYKHLEIDGETVGATFKTSGVDSRLELVHQPIGLFQGSLGGQFFYKDLSILGEEAFLQPTTSVAGAAFLFEEVKLGPLTLQFGGRVEQDNVSIDSSDPTLTSLTSPDQKVADFTPLSAAGGAIYHFLDDWELALNVTFSQRAPTAEELFARGAHDATFQFIVGDPNLGVETSRGVDLSLRKKAGVVTGSISGYYNSFSDFIDFTSTADFEDGLRVFNYTPKDADFFGGEAQVDFHLLPLTITHMAERGANDPKAIKQLITGASSPGEANPNDLFLRLQADYVHAEDSGGEPLPRITPLRYSASLNYVSSTWSASLEGQRVNRQYRTAQFETSTLGYTFLNASLSRRLRLGRIYLDAYLRGTNLTNEEARDHLSFLKDVLPLEGRSIIVGIRTTF